jgi:hypothetical protein
MKAHNKSTVGYNSELIWLAFNSGTKKILKRRSYVFFQNHLPKKKPSNAAVAPWVAGTKVKLKKSHNFF